ncbi:anthrone oxygenase family protein [Nocardia sp. NPDC101769]|uniref:anthrone oxygenase family protein n=1 Tax=Nocardia sp. NPDC101769 TaxID=3364333 RepID=UPI0038237D70
MIVRYLAATALACSGFLAGAFSYGSLVVRPAYWSSPDAVHNAYRAQFIPHNSPVMPTAQILGVALALLLAVVTRDMIGRVLSVGAAVATLACIVVTKFGNVPINNKIRSWNPNNPPADYLTMLHRWDTYHDIRTASVVLAFMLVIAATVRMIGAPARQPSSAPKTVVAV